MPNYWIWTLLVTAIVAFVWILRCSLVAFRGPEAIGWQLSYWVVIVVTGGGLLLGGAYLGVRLAEMLV